MNDAVEGERGSDSVSLLLSGTSSERVNDVVDGVGVTERLRDIDMDIVGVVPVRE